MNAGSRRGASRTKPILFVVLGSAALFSAGQSSETESGAAVKVRFLESRRAEAEMHKDTMALDAMFDNALVMIDADGTLRSKAEYLSRIRQAGTAVLQVDVEAMTVRSFGADTVIVDATYRDRLVRDGKTLVRRRRSIDSWVLKAGQWVCIAAAARAAP